MDPPPPPIEESHVVCPNCRYNLTGATIGGKCPECGTPVAQAVRVRPTGSPLPKQSYVLPVLVTVLCCVIGGIAAVVYTSQANTAAELGDLDAYDKALRYRKGWMIASVILGIVVGVVQFVAYL